MAVYPEGSKFYSLFTGISAGARGATGAGHAAIFRPSEPCRCYSAFMMHARTALACSSVFALAAVAAFQPSARTQPQETHAQRAERFRQRSIEAEKAGLATPFQGVTTNGTIQPGLYAIKSTGVSTEPVRAAAERLLGVLTREQRDKSTFTVDDEEWRKWTTTSIGTASGAITSR